MERKKGKKVKEQRGKADQGRGTCSWAVRIAYDGGCHDKKGAIPRFVLGAPVGRVEKAKL